MFFLVLPLKRRVVDSEPLACRILAEALRGLGLAMGDEEANEVFLGCSLEMVVEIWAFRLGRPVDAGFAEKFLDDLHAGMRYELDAISGVHAAIKKFRRWIGLALSVWPLPVRRRRCALASARLA